jgi:hypothetical protein
MLGLFRAAAALAVAAPDALHQQTWRLLLLTLLVQGQRDAIGYLGRHQDLHSVWVSRLKLRRGTNIATVRWPTRALARSRRP